MQLVRLTRRQRARLRLQVPLPLPLTNKQHRRLPPVPPQHLRRLPHPVRARNQAQARNLVQVRNRVRARSRLQARNQLRVRNQLRAPTPQRHRPASNMNFETMTFLVGRGSRSTEEGFRSSRRPYSADRVGPMDAPSRRAGMCYRPNRDSKSHIVSWHGQSPVSRLGERIGPAHHVACANQQPHSYRPAVWEPRPTKVAAASHLSLFTSHLAHKGYVCS